MSEYVPSDMCAHWRFRSGCAFVQSDQNLHWTFWIAKVWGRWQWRPWSDCANAQVDLSLDWMYMSDSIFSHIVAHFTWIRCCFLTKQENQWNWRTLSEDAQYWECYVSERVKYGGPIHFEVQYEIWSSTAHSVSLLAYHHLDMTEIMLIGV